MTAVPPPGQNGPQFALARAIVRGFDNVAKTVTNALQGLFGFQYSKNVEHYVYQVTQATGTADATGSTYSTGIAITQEADFVCTRLNTSTRISTSGTAALVGSLVGVSNSASVAGDMPDAPFTLLITDGGSDRQLSNEAVDAFPVYGTQGGLPGVWARPRLFGRNSRIGLRLTSLKPVPASTAWTYRIALIGWKIYDATSLDLTSRK